MLATTRRFRPALTLLVPLLAAVAGGCDGADLDDPEDLEFRDSAGQGGTPLNTSRIFTSDVAAIDTQGLTLNGVTLVGVTLEIGGVATAIDAGSLDVEQGELKALVGGVPVKATDFVDSEWSFDVGGDKISAVLTLVETSAAAGLWQPGDPNTLRMLDEHRIVYTFKWTDAEGTHTTCEEDSVGGARAVIYRSLVVNYTTGAIGLRPNTIYIACLSGAVGKAALWGYAPDSPSQPSVPLTAFTTATRMVRADYCADGTPHTHEGTPVSMRDRWGINDTFAPTFFTEAVWEAGGGAKCVRRNRKTGTPFAAAQVCPSGHVIPLCINDGVLQNQWTNQLYGEFWSKIE